MHNRLKQSAEITEFQRRVLLALLEVPKGKVVSYAELAKRVGCRSAQAIGQALKKNPYAPDVPCHRVLTKDGTIGGYLGERAGQAISKKMRLLKAEGVEFDNNGRLLECERLYHF